MKMRLIVVAGLALATMLPTAAFATPDHTKVGICHRTASDSNPYVYIEVDEAAVPAHLGNTHPGHDAKVWKSDGTFRGVEHSKGDPKDDYIAEQGKESCKDFEPEPCPDDELRTSEGEECEEPEPDLIAYKVVAGMPRYRGEEFYAEEGVEVRCSATAISAHRVIVECFGDDEKLFSDRLWYHDSTPPKRNGTYIRLREVGVPGPAQVILDYRSF